MQSRQSRHGVWVVMASAGFSLTAACQAPDGTEKVGKTGAAVSDEDNSPRASLRRPPDPHWTEADDAIIAPIWTGDENTGQLYTPLWRGSLPGIEELVFTPDDGDCRGRKFTIRVDWDSTADTVHFLIKGHHIV